MQQLLVYNFCNPGFAIPQPFVARPLHLNADGPNLAELGPRLNSEMDTMDFFD